MSEAELLHHNFITIAQIIQSVSMFMGLTMILSSLFQFRRYGESRTMMSQQYSIAGPLLMLLGGAMLLMLPSYISTMLLAFWGQTSPLHYPGSSSGYGALISPILLFVRIVGVGAFIRGVVLMTRAGGHQGQPGTFGKAGIHMLGGLLCVHIVGTKDLLQNILGL